MAMRNKLLGLAAALAGAGVAVAEPPVNPFVEGREPNPVVREFYESEPPTFGYGAGPVSPWADDARMPAAGWWAFGACQALADQMTMPLGMAQRWD